ncbi:cellulose biosynthesis cyclic di-GMP-binding regulatory protein BcsB, partial [Chromobacterium piscinae]
PDAQQVGTLLNALGNIGAQTGYPALRVQFSDDWSKAKSQDADLLMIGDIPKDLQDDRRIAALVDAAGSWIKTPTRQAAIDAGSVSEGDRAPESTTAIGSRG